MPPEASGPVFTVRKPIFSFERAGSRARRRARSMRACPSRRCGDGRSLLLPSASIYGEGFLLSLVFSSSWLSSLQYRDQSCPAGRTPAAAPRRLISCKDCDVFCGISSRFADTPSDSQVLGFDLVIGPQLVRTRGIDHPAFTHHVHVIDQLERERGVLFDQQNRMAFLLQPRDRLPQALDDDGREPLGRLVHDQAI